MLMIPCIGSANAYQIDSAHIERVCIEQILWHQLAFQRGAVNVWQPGCASSRAARVGLGLCRAI
jgi:hypothetical protein